MKCRLLLMTMVLMSSCGVTTSDSGASERVVKSAVVEAYDHQSREVRYPARVSAAVEANLSFRVAGVIDRIAVAEGERVRKGEAIVYMDRRDYELQLAATEAEYDGIKSEAERVIALYGEQSVSENDYDKAVNGLRRITAKRDAHRNALSDATLVAPFDGYLGKRLFNQGEAVAAGMAVVTFISSQSPELIVNLTADDYLRRAELTSASASFNIFPDQIFPLRLISISPTANLNQLYAARFEVESVGGFTPPSGITSLVTLSFDVEPSQSFEIPFSAVMERETGASVWVIEGEESLLSLRRVEVVELLSDGRAVVEGDIHSGDVVVAAGSRRLHEGERVRVLNVDKTL